MPSIAKKIQIGDGKDKEVVALIVDLLRDGKIVAVPTETVYGLACRADDEIAVKKLYDMKKRPNDKPFTYVLADAREAINNHFSFLSPFGYRLIEKFWPGPLTIVYNDKFVEKKIGIRVPDNEFLRAVLSKAEFPVVLPSANISNEKELLSADDVQRVFGEKIDLIVEQPTLDVTKVASTVVDLTFYPFKILREAAINKNQIIGAFARKRLVFVCAGNTCRSPMAQMLFKKNLLEQKPYFNDRLDICSRGISAFDGAAVSREAMDLLAQKDNILAYDFVSLRLQRYDILSADYIFVMQASQRDYIVSEEPAVDGKVFCLGQFLNDENIDIPDPIGCGIEEYERVYSLINEAVRELVDWF